MLNKCLIIIPAFNEEKNLPKLLVQIDRKKYYVLVVDDGSSDKTLDVIKNKCDKIIRLKKNLGVDMALNKGFKYAIKKQFQYIITMDADGQHKTQYLNKIYDMLVKKNDLVITQRKSFPRFSEKIFSIYTKKKFKVFDLLSGMKGYSINLVNQYKCYDTINSIGSELSAYAISNKYKFKLLNIKVNNRKGESRLGGMIRGNYKILKALIKLIILLK